jgi:hypothetical protein
VRGQFRKEVGGLAGVGFGGTSLWSSMEGGGKSSNRIWKVNVQVWNEVGRMTSW